jgi:dolichol-phosphate mannosyltransferase
MPDTYSIIVPTYNERENIGVLVWLIDEVCKANHISYEVVVVDDGSPDGTQQAVQQLQASFPQLPLLLVTRPRKLGLGTAYASGLTAARGSWVVLMDADLSHHPKYLPAFLARQAATGADIVAGSRYSPAGGVAGWSLGRKLTSRGANILAGQLLGATPRDLTGAYRLYRRELLEALLPAVGSKGYAFQMEMILRAQVCVGGGEGGCCGPGSLCAGRGRAALSGAGQ